MRASLEEIPWYPLHRSALICALVELGREGEARTELDALSHDDFSALYPDNEWLLGMSLAAEAAARLGATNAAETLYGQLVPLAGRHVSRARERRRFPRRQRRPIGGWKCAVPGARSPGPAAHLQPGFFTGQPLCCGRALDVDS